MLDEQLKIGVVFTHKIDSCIMCVNKEILYGEIHCLEEMSLNELIEKSKEFGKLNRFGSTNTTCEKLLERGYEKEILLENAKSAYPIVHHKVLKLIEDFLELKKKHGTPIEKNIYNNLKTSEFIDRLLTKRPLVFVGQRDTYILRDGKKEGVAFEDWHTLGSKNEKDPLVMADYLTYDEGKVAALLCASTRTVNINKGDRKNSGVVQEDGNYEKEGVIVGLVGPRMNKSNALESQEMRVNEEQNIPKNGYDEKGVVKHVLKLFANFYGIKHLPTFKELEASYRKSRGEEYITEKVWKVFSRKVKSDLHLDYEEISGLYNSCQFLHIPAYRQRNRIAIETLLVEANYRASQLDKKAYVHVVGLGLGVWRIYNRQVEIFTREVVETAADMNLPDISDIDLSWVINEKECQPKTKSTQLSGSEVGCHDTKLLSGDTIPGTKTVLHISTRDPWEKLDQVVDKVVVASWAWDGMSFVGNEYWAGSLASSSDPAAACCTQMPELLNPLVNPHYGGHSAMVVTDTGGLVPLTEYQEARTNNKLGLNLSKLSSA